MPQNKVTWTEDSDGVWTCSGEMWKSRNTKDGMAETYLVACDIKWNCPEGTPEENEMCYCPRCGGFIDELHAFMSHEEKTT